MLITQYINHVERSTTQGFKPLTPGQFATLVKKIEATRGWDKV